MNPDPCVEKLKVLADRTRLEVVRLLMDGPLRVSEINEHLRIEQSLLSHHLRSLREAGIVTCERDGKGMLYRLAPEVGSMGRRAIDLGCCSISFDGGEGRNP